MQSKNANERIKREYFTYLAEAKGRSEAMIDQVASSVDRFQAYTKEADFRKFHREKVKAFKTDLIGQVSATTGEKLSHATVYAILTALRVFFQWLAGQRGYKQAFEYGDWDYFTPTGATASIAKAHRLSRAPTIDEIRRVIELMPNSTEVERRNRAIIAFLIVTGGRVSAVASFQLKHLDIRECLVMQDARVVKTKKRKTFPTWLFPVGEDLERIVLDWAAYLRTEKKWSARDPLFPRTRVVVNGGGEYQADGLDRAPWASSGAIRKIVREAFTCAGLPYPNPHAFRQTIVAYGSENCVGFAAMQAWAQNLGHDSLTTTFGSYGKVLPDEQGKLVRGVRPRTAYPTE